ncbi:restriction endonuclease subunit S [Vagococcus lutrae]|uniref:restriction endonuclease subunit S n=1 Tax=Vagococcus lutrae TaxID=81947 RepID=UPI0023A974B5|nr:restriction endonuclease subunit S [Vagococcus lutrae]WEB81028.1 restriction endonuclease subunit S [Vagococcus lutrae]
MVNHHLYALAKTIFESWFIKLEPFNGEIPFDWKKINFEEITTVQNGFAFKSKDYITDGVDMIRTTNFDNGYVNNYDLIQLPKSFYMDSKYQNFKFNRFDTVIVMVGASVGKISLITDLNLPSLQNQNMWRFRPTMSGVPESFIHFYVTIINDKVRGWSSGSARDFYRKDLFKTAKINLPSQSVLRSFASLTMPIFEQINALIVENDRLTRTRGVLLPKLMSGEISVMD